MEPFQYSGTLLSIIEVACFTSRFRLLPETPAVFVEWLRLAEQRAVSGKQVHDALLNLHSTRVVDTVTKEDAGAGQLPGRSISSD
jgi:hypothetical protein